MTDPDILRRTAERMREDESLSGDLVDEAATILLAWGQAQIQALACQAEALAPEEMDARLAELRRTLKRVNRRAGEAAPEEQASQVQALLAEIAAQSLPPGAEPAPSPRQEPSAPGDRETGDAEAGNKALEGSKDGPQVARAL